MVLVRRPFPQTTGTIDVPGLVGTVEVVRDEHGIPQLYGDSMDDLMRAQGYVHAQDRFFEMDVRRHATAGRLAEMFGKDALESDEYVRTMGWRRVAERELALVSPETRSALQAYADGVNAYLDTHSPSQIAVEYTVMNAGGHDYRPEHWTPADSTSWLLAMAWDLRGNMTEEIQRALALTDHTPAEVAELWPSYPYAAARPDRRPGRGRRRRLRAGRDRPGHPQPAASGVHRRPAGRALRGWATGSRRCRRCWARATASAATAGSSTARTRRPVRRSWPTTRTSA